MVFTSEFARIIDRISDFIDSNLKYLVDATVQFIRAPSPSGSEGKVAEILLRELESRGFKSMIDEAGNVVGEMGEGDYVERKTLAFNVHLDHVPPGRRESWKYDPFGGVVENGRIYGRGAADTKGAWAPMILAMEAVRELGKIKGKVLFTGVVMEELTYCFGMKYLLEKTLRKRSPDYIISGEATSLNVAVGHRGRAELEVVTKGRACHASAPWRGENALYKAARAIIALEGLSRDLMDEVEHPLLGRSTLSVTDIRCSPGARNVVPDECRFYVDYRFRPKECLEDVLRRINEKVKAEGADANVIEIEDETYTGLKFVGKKYMPGFEISPDHHLVRVSVAAAESLLKFKPKIQRWDFATDGGYSMGVKGIPTVGFSPCEEELAHAPNESVSIDYMKKAAKVYAMIILMLCG
ncbi:MAG: YgeY family selenium metabolism-linked hydrolase [Candidatus Methanomethylicia archaeon]|jgi:putative selenium metabolism hydrolase|nr:YgeY family selenium metabolism-linked hydrolase [Candidatus Methanomethylicia archaeon]MCQ5374482.1 YgeY family selenium metabolism-linked hydrolase [Candidatus Methanomethylicia archaeon]